MDAAHERLLFSTKRARSIKVRVRSCSCALFEEVVLIAVDPRIKMACGTSDVLSISVSKAYLSVQCKVYSVESPISPLLRNFCHVCSFVHILVLVSDVKALHPLDNGARTPVAEPLVSSCESAKDSHQREVLTLAPILPYLSFARGIWSNGFQKRNS